MDKFRQWCRDLKSTLTAYLIWYSLIAYVKLSKLFGLRGPFSQSEPKDKRKQS